MKPYVLFKAGDKDYRLRINLSSAVELEDKLNCSVVDGLNRLGEVRILAKYFYAAANSLNDDIKEERDALDVIDEFTMQGGKIEDLLEIMVEVMECSGYIKQEAVDASKKFKAQLMEKQAELLSK
ncbi:MAG: hypothetical protein MJ095_00225 [Oscillospiraceae bacterium]|nr:hypothetical protein [Oscillospiraceae bacterium]